MSQNYYKLYVDSVFSLASTIVIKSALSAETLNNKLILQYGESAVDQNDQTSWKYYLNVCGYYHPRDEQITITSLDTGVEIVFDYETLQDHPVTRASYEYGTRFFRELVTIHPDKELIILGSLYPATMEFAIAAEDGQVLAYPKYLIEEQEISLIKNIDKWIKNYKIRWDNKQFNVTDSLYGAVNHGLLYLNLVPLIINLRLQACKTNEAHSFHVRQYLASHGMLDVYLDDLTLKQALFLYRNICYIERNNGKREIFSWLVEKILTDRNIPIAEYTMRHNTAQMSRDIYADISFKRKELNNIYSGFNSNVDRITLDRLLAKEELEAPDNREYSFYNRDRIQSQFENSLSSVVATKVLESSLIDYSSDDPYPLIDIQLNHWLFYSSLGIYNGRIRVEEPRTGSEYFLTPFEAYVYWFYIYCKSIGVNLNQSNLFSPSLIPDFLCNRVVSPTRVTIGDFASIADITNIPADILSEVIFSQVATVSLNGVNEFNTQCLQILKNSNHQQALISVQEHMDVRGMVDNCVNRLYIDQRINTANVFSSSGTNSRNYPAWLVEKGIIDYDYTHEECEIIYSKIFTSATGGSLYTTLGMAQLQRAMIKLMKQLSSYSVQYITEINQSSIRKLNWAAIRLGDIERTDRNTNLISEVKILPFNVVSDEQNYTPIDTNTSAGRALAESVQSNETSIEIKVKPYFGETATTLHSHEVRFGTITINPCLYNDPAFVGGIKVLDSFENFYSLTQPQQETVKDVYYDVFRKDPNAGKVNLSIALLRNMIPDFNYTKLIKKKLKGFNYVYIPQTVESGVRSLLSVELDAFYESMGTQSLNAFKLMNKEAIASLFKYFGSTTILNSFKNSGGNLVIDPGIIADLLGMGTSLDIFKGLTTPAILQGLTYSSDTTNVNFTFTTDKYSINFVRPFFTTSVALHPTEPGQVANAFKLISSSSVIGGFEYRGYNLAGFSYNGTQIDFS